MKKKYIRPIIRVIDDDEVLLAGSGLIFDEGEENVDGEDTGGGTGGGDGGGTGSGGFVETKGNGFGWEDLSGW